ncbi:MULTISPECIES: ABC transporter permease [Corynebacterium]|uniref:ABC transporter permease n=1 Tax=Corynebacterium TaxID=1716 RepID=UPI00124D892A|nr:MULTISPECIES: ABC transporter permease [Corynebacterium]
MTFLLLNLRRVLTDKAGLFFSVALPVFFYIIFGASQPYGEQPLNHGNVNAYVMIGMAFYAGAVGAVGGAGTTVLEGVSGWNRQLALTPLKQRTLIAAQAAPLALRALLPVVAVYITGAIAGAEMPLKAWVLSGVLCVLVSLPFGLYGTAWAQLLRTNTAVGVASSSLVVLAFAGNVFTPLPESFLPFVRFTPAYGPGALARYPLTEGIQAIADESGTISDPLSYALISVVAWTVAFSTLVLLLNRRDKSRA